LVTEPTAKLIGIMDIQPDGGGYKANDGLNLLASTDEWMSPIFADVGPDGAVWLIDFYSFIIQHNPTPNIQSAGIEATTGRGGAYKTENDLRDKVHGRIYRVVWKDGPRSSIKSLAKTKPAELIAALDSGNQFWSLTAQRLIVDSKVTDTTAALKRRVRSGTGGKGAIHALWSLAGIGALDKDTHQKALLDKDPALRRNAIRALPATDAGRELFFSSPVIQDPNLITRQVAFVKLAEFPTIPGNSNGRRPTFAGFDQHGRSLSERLADFSGTHSPGLRSGARSRSKSPPATSSAGKNCSSPVPRPLVPPATWSAGRAAPSGRSSMGLRFAVKRMPFSKA
jgi:uncharacterized protein